MTPPPPRPKFAACVAALACAAALCPPLGLTAAGADAPGGSAAAGDRVSFNRDVRPILSDRCYHCHGPDPARREAGLRLDVRGEAEYVWDVGDAGASELLARVTSGDEYTVMPPPDAHKPAVTAAEADLLRRWIAQGAEYEPHWAFTPPARPSVPAEFVPAGGNAVDGFVGRALAGELDLDFAPEAPPAQLLRRVALDLTGLPPTAGDMRRFEREYEVDPDRAYAEAVDRLLASPHFGERMARDWLDVARYADTNGYQQDLVRTNWPWRDWVVDAFNANKPYDAFVVEQLAGDLLAGPDGEGPTTDQLIATAFNRNHMINGEGGAIAEENLAKYAFDRVETAGTTFLGLTVGCAQCHDHKFDPVTQRDYYAMIALFNQIGEPGGIDKRWKAADGPAGPGDSYGIAGPYVSLADDGQAAKLADLHAKVAAARQARDAKWDDWHPAFVAWVGEMKDDAELRDARLPTEAGRFVGIAPLDRVDNWETQQLLNPFFDAHPEYKPLRDAIWAAEAAEEAAQADVPLVMVMRDDRPRDTFILKRGNYETPGEKVDPGVPAFLPPLPDGVEADRLALANWLVSGDHPLTARVAVNRFWQSLLGRPLVGTPGDFGLQGAYPTHPELLDWLAVEFVDSGWDVKALLRTVVLSRAYRQTAQVSAGRVAADPENKFYARGSRGRLDSRAIRDQALAISGLLAGEVGGPPVKPYQPPGVWEEMSLGKNRFVRGEGADLYRRSLYTFWRRVVGPTNFFDVPARQVCEVAARRTSTPLQALTLLNDTTYVEAARVWAGRLLARRNAGEFPDDRAVLTEAFYTATARRPTERELTVLADLLADARARYAADPDKAAALLETGEAPRNADLEAAEHAAWAAVCSVVLNTDEAISKP